KSCTPALLNLITPFPFFNYPFPLFVRGSYFAQFCDAPAEDVFADEDVAVAIKTGIVGMDERSGEPLIAFTSDVQFAIHHAFL
ncbi:MAG: hypothetical protein KDA91_23340, partial [Planctomycetaceae bacterium]|nr:hypothetical protein [Planctomycetaceae bacterium]